MKNITPAAQRFILHWGEMGTRWGVNRTVAQIHALLMVSPHPLPADVICERLAVARSNVSNSLRELQGWGLVRVVHISDDRRDHFETLADVWEMFKIIAQERKRREFDPTMAMFQECLAEADPKKEKQLVERVKDLQGFFHSAADWYAQLFMMPTGMLKQVMKVGSALKSLVKGS
jgi:DNA-binding transcriptional regulator GbsR (MarR family)